MWAAAIWAPSLMGLLPIWASSTLFPRLQTYTLSPAFKACPRTKGLYPACSARRTVSAAQRRSVLPASRNVIYSLQ